MSTDQTKTDLVITRVIDAPIEKVWQAWHDPQIIKQWWGPTGFTAPLVEIDFRVGGKSLLCMSAPDFGTHYSTWHYRDIVPMQHIDLIHNLTDKDGNPVNPVDMGMPADFPQNQRQLVTFKPVDDGKTELTVTEYGWTVGQMMEMSEMGMNQCLDKMAAALKLVGA